MLQLRQIDLPSLKVITTVPMTFGSFRDRLPGGLELFRFSKKSYQVTNINNDCTIDPIGLVVYTLTGNVSRRITGGLIYYAAEKIYEQN